MNITISHFKFNRDTVSIVSQFFHHINTHNMDKVFLIYRHEKHMALTTEWFQKLIFADKQMAIDFCQDKNAKTDFYIYLVQTISLIK